MAFEIFTSSVARRDSPSVTISPTGRMSFNKAATGFLEKVGASHVLLLWDSESGDCAVQTANKDDTRSFKLSYGTKGNGAGFSATPFLNYIGYDMVQSRSLPMQWKENGKMFVFKISEDLRAIA